MVQINRQQAKDLIGFSRGKIFTTTHTKKDNTIRITNCRTGVKKGITGEGMKYNPVDFNLIPVYDMQNKGYRMINIDTLSVLKINHETYEVSNE